LLMRPKKVRARECRKANDPMDKARELQQALYRAAKRMRTPCMPLEEEHRRAV
jgi:hypothetical protein